MSVALGRHRTNGRRACLRHLAVFAGMFVISTPSRTSAQEPSMLSFQSAGATLTYHILGSRTGTPLVVVAGGPGFDHGYMHLSPVWDSLAKTRPVVFYDQRGTGRASPFGPKDAATLTDFIGDLDALRQQLATSRIDVLGHSWGGYLAMAYAARHPDRVDHVILVDAAAPKWSETIFLFNQVFPEAIARQQTFAFAEALGDTLAVQANIHEYLGMLFYSPAHRDAFLRDAAGLRYNQFLGRAMDADLARYDLGPELPKFRSPVLVITGRHDMNVAPLVAYRIHQAIPSSQFVVFERSGHLPFYEEPTEFVQVVDRFLRLR